MDNILNSLISGRYNHTELMITKAKGAEIIDEKKGIYIDYVLGNLTQILGHGALNLNELFQEVSKDLINVGDQPNPHCLKLADKVLKIANMDMLRFTNSGSEAVHLAMRLARAYTGRQKILKFVGHYHGWMDEEIGGFLEADVTEGIPQNAMDNIIKVQWNDKKKVQEVFEKEKIAAVICEPVLAHSGTIPHFDNFLQFLRDITNQYRSILIFDECVTGFRVALGGAQEFFNVSADIVVYSKALSGGVPLGVMAGKKNIMEKLKDGSVYHASTYDCNPISTAISLRVIDEIENKDIINTVKNNGEELICGLKNLFEINKQKVIFQSVGAFFQFYFTDKDSIRSYEEAMDTDYLKYKRFVKLMYDKNVFVSEGELWSNNVKRNWIGSWFLSAKHNSDIIKKTLDAAAYAIKEL